MLPQTLKSENGSSTDFYPLFQGGKRISEQKFENNRISLCLLLCLIISIGGVIMICLSIWGSAELNTLRTEVEGLRKELNALNYDFVSTRQYWLDEFRRFENEDSYEDEEENDVDDEGIEDDTGNILDYEGDLGQLEKGGTHTKEGKETVVLGIRTRRDIVSSTADGVPINSESYAEVRKNKTHRSKDGLRFYETLTTSKEMISRTTPTHHLRYNSPAMLVRSGDGSASAETLRHYNQMTVITPSPTPVISRQSRVMHTDEDKSKAFRRVIKKSMLKSNSRTEDARPNYQEHMANSDVTIIREDAAPHRRKHNRHRNSNLEAFDGPSSRTGTRKIMPVIHFGGDTSKYVLGQHTDYNGNGHLRNSHPDMVFVDWAPSSWVKGLGMDRYYQMHNGYLTIKEAGLYFVYAQIYYLNEHDTNGYRVYKNEDTLLQCTTMTHTEKRVTKGNTCYTAGAEYLTEGDRVSIRDLSASRASLFEPGKSFLGVIKLSDVKIK